MSAKITVDFSAGETIGDAITWAKKFCIKNDCDVQFVFNGVRVIVFKKTNIKELERKYMEAIREGGDFIFG